MSEMITERFKLNEETIRYIIHFLIAVKSHYRSLREILLRVGLTLGNCTFIMEFLFW